jgi:hypothetical protein
MFILTSTSGPPQLHREDGTSIMGHPVAGSRTSPVLQVYLMQEARRVVAQGVQGTAHDVTWQPAISRPSGECTVPVA